MRLKKVFEIRSLDHLLLQKTTLKLFKAFRFFGGGERHPVCMHTHKPARKSLASFDSVTVDIQKYWGGRWNVQSACKLVLGVRTHVRNCQDLSRGFGILERM